MAFSFDLPESIPVFPLPKAVLLPRSRLPLHIFEPRYLSMIEDAMKTPGRLIGMIQPAGEDRLHTNDQFGLSLLDVSTGDFFLSKGSLNYILNLMKNFEPKEILISRKDLKFLADTNIDDVIIKPLVRPRHYRRVMHGSSECQVGTNRVTQSI